MDHLQLKHHTGSHRGKGTIFPPKLYNELFCFIWPTCSHPIVNRGSWFKVIATEPVALLPVHRHAFALQQKVQPAMAEASALACQCQEPLSQARVLRSAGAIPVNLRLQRIALVVLLSIAQVAALLLDPGVRRCRRYPPKAVNCRNLATMTPSAFNCFELWENGTGEACLQIC